MKFIDIGANLTDTMYSGEYNGTARHPSDLQVIAITTRIGTRILHTREINKNNNIIKVNME